MTRHNSPTRGAQASLRSVARHPWLEPLARSGYAAKGIVYFVVGLLAAQAAFGTGGKTTDTSGALTSIVTQPFGKFLLGIVAIGLIGYSLWRLVQAIYDPEHAREETGAKQIAERFGYAISGFAYLGLAWTAAGLIFGVGRGGNRSSNATQDWTARLIAQPFGQWLVGLAGLVVLGIGLSYFYKAYKAKFRRELKMHEMSHTEQTWAIRVGRFGIAARGVVFSMIGIFLIQAALKADASEARGLGGALATLASQPFGPWLLGIVALGLIAYSIYSIVEARYRQIIQP